MRSHSNRLGRYFRSGSVPFFVVLTLALAAGSASLEAQPGKSQGQGSPPPMAADFDIRGPVANAMPQSVADKIQLIQASGPQAAALARARSKHAGLQVRWSELTGAPSRMQRRGGFLTGPSNASPNAIASEFIAEQMQLMGLADADLSEQRTVRNAKSKNNGVTNITLQQQVNGLDIFGATLSINIAKDGSIINFSGEPMPGVHASVNAQQASITSDQAVQAAAESASVNRIKSSVVRGLVYFPIAVGDSRLAWEVVVYDADTPNGYRTLVDATDGTVLWRRNGTKYAHIPTHGAVFSSDSPVPNNPIGPSPTEVPRDDMPFHGAGQVFPPLAGSPNFTHDDDHYDWWNGSGEGDRSRTVSNNATAQDDIGDTNSSGSPVTVAGDDFTQPLDLTMEPDTYTPAAVVNLFYWINLYHDITYRYGFTEAWSNYQVDNFGNGGSGGDPVIGDAQDGSGLCNANFDTNANEGSPGRVQMFICDSATPSLDGDFSAGTIIHELHHGLAERIRPSLHGGAQGGGMGEGGGDFQDIAFLVKPGDDLNGGYGHSQYYTSNPNGNRGEPFSIRPDYPNTYGDMGSSVHANGEIWANALWIARAFMDARYGFVGATDTIVQLQLDGYKLSPDDPDFLDMRDAILLADLANYDGANQCLLWQAFARQGMGLSATSLGNDDQDPVEAFNVPLSCLPVLSVNPTNLDFGQVPVDPVNAEIGVRSMNVNVCNTGNQADLFLTNVVIEGEDPESDFSVSPPNPGGFPVQISHDFCFPVEVRCDPSDAGVITGNLQIESSDPLNPVINTVALSCTGTTPDIQVPSDIDFGEVCIGDVASDELNVCNTGFSHLLVDSISDSGAPFDVLSPLQGYPVDISPDFCFPFEATFAPQSLGTHLGSAQIFSNDSGSPTAVGLTGFTPAPEINHALANSGDFGEVCAGTHADLSLTLFNQGRCDLTISNIELVPPGTSFTLPDDLDLPLVLSHDADFNLPIRFAPEGCSDTPENAVVRITSDDPDQPVVDIPISAVSPCPNLVIDPLSMQGLHAFPATVADSGGTLGCHTDRTLVLRNTANCPLTIDGISALGDANVADFAVIAPTQFPVLLPGGEETLEVTVRFTPQADPLPTAPTELTGLLTVMSDDPDSDHTAELCGEGVTQSGVRILVTDISSGIPLIVPEVDSITLSSKGKNRPGPVNLMFTNQPASSAVVCGNTIHYHVDQETLPSTANAGPGPQSSYQANAKEGNLQASDSFQLGQCEFRETQLQLQDSTSEVCLLSPKGAACSNAGECCSGKCSGPSGNKTCK